MVAASRWVRDSNSNMKWKGLDDHLVLGLEKEAIRLAAEVEAVRRNGDGFRRPECDDRIVLEAIAFAWERP